MIIGILKETGAEKRVAMLPGEVAGLKKMGVDVVAERLAGKEAFISDNEFQAAGATISERSEVKSRSALLLSVNPLPEDEINTFSEGTGPLFCCKSILETKNGLKGQDFRV